MDLLFFLAACKAAELPSDCPPALLALWYDAQGEWHKAHTTVQSVRGGGTEWVHAYLHRKEGDEWNARYWYQTAGKPFTTVPLKQEWQLLAAALCSNAAAR